MILYINHIKDYCYLYKVEGCLLSDVDNNRLIFSVGMRQINVFNFPKTYTLKSSTKNTAGGYVFVHSNGTFSQKFVIEYLNNNKEDLFLSISWETGYVEFNK